MKQITIAIDGYSSCGKSTLAKGLAAKLGYTYIDSGAMYRAVTLYFLRNEIPLKDAKQVDAALESITIRFASANNHTLLNGEDVEEEIRQMPVSNLVSPVSAIPAVRRAMVRLQQAMGKDKGIVMDGRDIGTVVFPTAELKIFLTADPEVRAQRRYDELLTKGVPSSLESVRANLQHRDHIDSTREDSPLRQAEDAIVIDNTYLNEAQQLQKALEIAQAVLKKNNR
ncbi:MAG: (d)CMP kinase [Phaeodactylibacter sp.]|nr:(d)CMP kinase [Phaeodactylibacter sp.]MCB9303741.1 (d)CMP kinase [Lewinellaceae bacterium]HQU61003.1 (d)CMP kinase [Saprospiraceae bacterium]